VLHEVVAEHLETFLAELAQEGMALPRYVVEELRRYLPCGLLSQGFARVVCHDCHREILVAFSCKGRAFCPSCCARRMSDTAAHLIDRVLPEVPYRQWVLSYPRRLRVLLARDARATTLSASIFLQEVFRWQRQRAKREGLKGVQTGAVTFTQRFGSVLNLNIHHHAVVPDGVFTDASAAHFQKQRPPTLEELEKILLRIVKRTLSMLARRGLLDVEDVDGLGAIQVEAAQAGLGAWAAPEKKKLAAFLEGFSMEAGTHLHANDRRGLEHLCRYGLRPPLALERLHRLADGRVMLELRRPMHDGVRAVAFTTSEFLRRLAAIVPPPRSHQTRYFGVFAPRSAIRASLVPQPRADGEEKQETPAPPMPPRKRRLPWADLLKRVFGDDLLQCPCGGRRKMVAFIPGPKMAQEILAAIGVEAPPLVIAKARAPPHQESFELPVDYRGVDPQYPDSP
jgi:hypothetical protein